MRFRDDKNDVETWENDILGWYETMGSGRGSLMFWASVLSITAVFLILWFANSIGSGEVWASLSGRGTAVG